MSNHFVKPLYDRLREEVDAFMGNLIMPMVGDIFAKQLEKRVSEWLADNSEEVK